MKIGMIKDMLKLALFSFITIMAYISAGFEQFVVMAFTLLFFRLFITEERERKLKRRREGDRADG